MQSKRPNRGQRRLGFVPPRYGDDVIGGAEIVLRQAAHGLAARGYDVEVLTTCARDHYTWANEYPQGTSSDGGLTVRRFPGVISSREERFRYESAILAGHELTLEDQQRWLNDDLRVPELFHYLLANAARYDALVFSPYMFWTTFACSQVAPDRSLLVPCLHDEPYAYLELFQPMFSSPRGIWFMSEPEHQLAHRLFSLPQNHEVTGEGLPVPARYDPDRFRARHGIEGRFVLYAGRREGAKGWEELLAAFERATSRQALPFSLVTFGIGEVKRPPGLAGRLIDLGYVSDEERDDAYAAADAYIQPSRHESFSRTIMEAWLAGTIVIANAASDVVSWHCERSGAGLSYRDEFELEQCLRFVAAMPDAAAQLARGGRDYVLSNYTWDAVLDRMEAALEEWL